MGVVVKVIRWLLVPVSAAAVVAAAVLGARWAVSVIDRRCPVENMIGGACVEPWHTSAVEAAIYTAVVLAALGLAVLPALIAPQLERTVSTLGFLIAAGALGALYVLTTWEGVLTPLLLALAGGGLGLWWIWRRRWRNDPA